MDLQHIEKYLSDFLGLPNSAIFEGSGEMSSLCLMELASSVEMPSGFFLTEAVRIPRTGEYFLDAKALVERDRLVVYKAIGPLYSLGIILETEDEVSSTLTEDDYPEFGAGGASEFDEWKEESSNISFTPPETPSGFNWVLCESHGGLALHGKDVVEILSNYIDPHGIVSAIQQKSKRLIYFSLND